jgi:hypothetical protein
MGRPKSKIFTEKDWKDADQLDRIYMHILEPNRWELSFRDQDKLDLLRETWAIMSKKATWTSRLKLMQQVVDAPEGVISKLYRDAQHVFGDLMAVDIETELSASYQRFMKMYEKAQEVGDFEAARRCQGDALKVLQMIEDRKPKQARVYAEISFTDNPQALRARNMDVEDITYEDASHLLEPKAVELPADNTAV